MVRIIAEKRDEKTARSGSWPATGHSLGKHSGACTLSHEPFPYLDIWAPLARVFDEFGLDRCLWGTDSTRAVKLLTYRKGVEAFRITDRPSESDKATLMGGSLTRVYNWAPSPA
jgi:L-fuconolactonase